MTTVASNFGCLDS